MNLINHRVEIALVLLIFSIMEILNGVSDKNVLCESV